MNDTTSIEDDFKRVMAAAKSNAIPAVNGLLSSEKIDEILKVGLAPADFVDAMGSLKPRMMYYDEEKFDADAAALYALTSDDDEDETDDLPESLTGDKRYRDFIAKWKKRNGTLSEFTALFLVDGVLHICRGVESWVEDFQNELNAIAVDVARAEEEQEREETFAEADQRKQRAKKLADHKLFDAPKSSHAKRCFLAEQLFPDVEREEISEIVELAENMAWYAKGSD